MVDVVLMKQFYFFIDGGQQFHRPVIRINDLTRVRVKGRDNGFTSDGLGIRGHPLENESMPQMHSVKGSEGNHGLLNSGFLKCFNGAVNVHVSGKCAFIGMKTFVF